MGIQIKLEMTKDKAAKYNGKWVEARDNGMFTSLKTKLKNTDTLLLYDGVTKTKGLSDDEDVEITVSFDGDDNLQQVSKITKGSKTINTNRSFKIVNNQLVLSQSCNG